MIATLLYLAGVLVALVIGIVIGVWFTRRHEAERLDIALALRESAGGLIRQQTIRGRLADAWQADAEQWQQVADTLDFPLTDYTSKETT